MNSLTELKNETTLASIAEAPEANLHYLLFAVVIDVSEPNKNEESSNYITKLKVIDPSFNYKEELKLESLKFHKFVHINVYSEKPEDAPTIKYVGDIIRLRRFKFKYTSRGELMGNDVKYSNWLVYSGQSDGSLESDSYKRYDKNFNRQLNKYELNRLTALREWNSSFFFKNSLKYINWWNDWRETDEERARNTTTYKNVDLILKCRTVDTVKKNRLAFVDKDGQSFDLFIADRPSLKPNNIIKLRCVEVTVTRGKEVTRTIKLTNLSSCLLIPTFSYDYRQFDKAAQEKRSPAKSVKGENKLPFLNDYTAEDATEGKSTKTTPKKGGRQAERFITAVKKTHARRDAVSVASLLATLKNPGQQHGHRFVVKGYVAGFVSTDPNDIIKRMNTDDKKIVSFRDRSLKDRKTRIIYHLVLHVKDASVEQNDEFLNVYVLTGEFESHLFEAWGILPTSDDITAWNGIKETKLNEFEKKLKNVKSPEHRVKLVLELMITKTGKPFYRLVDTIFTNF